PSPVPPRRPASRPRLRLTAVATLTAGFLTAGPLTAATLAAPPSLGAQERAPHGPSIPVGARLDRDGVLHVRETQAMRFTGDWNGGERRFNVNAGQRLDLDGMVRLDSATGREVTMVGGDLDVVDGFDWAGNRTLRWRSRLPGDPPFHDALRTYRLDYSYRNILVPDGDAYRLDHDFAFTDREGPIEAFTLRLTLDPAWRAPDGFTGEFGPLRLDPGYGFTVDIPLRYLGGGRPAGVVFGADPMPRYTLAALLVALVVAMIVRFAQRERSLGRFAPGAPADVIDEAWLRRIVFAHRPEVIGAAWDEETGAAEVTAVLARLEQEGKIDSRVERRQLWLFGRNVLHMKLLADREQLGDYERSLIDALFFDGRTEVDTDDIRKHYATSGFAPSTKIEGPLQRLVERMVPDDDAPPKPGWRPTAALVVAAIGLFVATGITRPDDLLVAVAGAMAATIWYVVMLLLQARLWRPRVEGAAAHALRFLVPMAVLLAAFVLVVVQGRFRAGILVLAGLAVLLLALCRSALNTAMWRHGPGRMQLRRQLAAARRYLARELRQPQPRLRDAWFPYLIAFGLGPHMDKWFAAFGGAAHGAARSATSWGDSSSGHGAGHSPSGSGSATWSGLGGGGGFAGGGSSGAWVAAAGAISAGVAKPGSGSSGGSASSGGSSSGGGGGGGW
ncbi:MAG TPA: DUF2207 domain-containing protein, partial [Gemmatimonadaceae bacterium]|nr:DUF2207 domain-containing protein [Gemmatimonadaceae bacterium]